MAEHGHTGQVGSGARVGTVILRRSQCQCANLFCLSSRKLPERRHKLPTVRLHSVLSVDSIAPREPNPGFQEPQGSPMDLTKWRAWETRVMGVKDESWWENPSPLRADSRDLWADWLHFWRPWEDSLCWKERVGRQIVCHLGVLPSTNFYVRLLPLFYLLSSKGSSPWFIPPFPQLWREDHRFILISSWSRYECQCSGAGLAGEKGRQCHAVQIVWPLLCICRGSLCYVNVGKTTFMHVPGLFQKGTTYPSQCHLSSPVCALTEISQPFGHHLLTGFFFALHNVRF